MMNLPNSLDSQVSPTWIFPTEQWCPVGIGPSWQSPGKIKRLDHAIERQLLEIIDSQSTARLLLFLNPASLPDTPYDCG